MLKRNMVRTPICLFLSLLMLFDFTVFTPQPAQALDTKSVLVGAGAGAAAGVGITLAAPAIAGAVGAAAGGLAGIGTAIVGGLAAVGGAIVGVGAAIGGAAAASLGAVAGWIVGIIASPLFVPALVIIAAAVIGYYLYRRHQRNKAEQNNEVFPNSDGIFVTPGEYDMSPVIPPMNQTGPITIGDSDVVVIPGDGVRISDTPPAAIVIPEGASPLPPPAGTTPSVRSLAEAQSRYERAYNRYTSLVTTGGSGSIQEALAEYRAAYREYMDLKAASGK